MIAEIEEDLIFKRIKDTSDKKTQKRNLGDQVTTKVNFYIWMRKYGIK